MLLTIPLLLGLIALLGMATLSLPALASRTAVWTMEKIALVASVTIALVALVTVAAAPTPPWQGLLLGDGTTNYFAISFSFDSSELLWYLALRIVAAVWIFDLWRDGHKTTKLLFLWVGLEAASTAVFAGNLWTRLLLLEAGIFMLAVATAGLVPERRAVALQSYYLRFACLGLAALAALASFGLGALSTDFDFLGILLEIYFAASVFFYMRGETVHENLFQLVLLGSLSSLAHAVQSQYHTPVPIPQAWIWVVLGYGLIASVGAGLVSSHWQRTYSLIGVAFALFWAQGINVAATNDKFLPVAGLAVILVGSAVVCFERYLHGEFQTTVFAWIARVGFSLIAFWALLWRILWSGQALLAEEMIAQNIITGILLLFSSLAIGRLAVLRAITKKSNLAEDVLIAVLSLCAAAGIAFEATLRQGTLLFVEQPVLGVVLCIAFFVGCALGSFVESRERLAGWIKRANAKAHQIFIERPASARAIIGPLAQNAFERISDGGGRGWARVRNEWLYLLLGIERKLREVLFEEAGNTFAAASKYIRVLNRSDYMLFLMLGLVLSLVVGVLLGL